jgi:galactonate dehydratase
MRITEIKTFLMQAEFPPENAYATADSGKAKPGVGSSAGSRNWLFVKIYTDAGITGIGECSGWPRVVERAVQDLATILVGEDPGNIERLWQKMFGAIMGHGMTGVVGAGAMSGIDMALWDIKGKVLQTPLWNLLGGKVRERIRVYGHANTPEVALSLKARGITAVKTGGVSRIVEKVDAIRQAVGDDMDVMVDLHGPPWMTTKDAIITGKALEPYNLLFFEDPIAPENCEALARIQEHVDIPIAAGERFATIWGMRALIERELVDVIQPDTGRAGGVTQLMKIAAMAEAHHISVAPHSGSLGPIAEFAALHVLAAIPNTLILERLEDDWAGRYEVTDPVARTVDGYLPVPDAPGLGIDIVEDAVARYPSKRNVAVAGGPETGAYAAGTFGEQVYFQTRFHRRKAFSKGKHPVKDSGG